MENKVIEVSVLKPIHIITIWILMVRFIFYTAIAHGFNFFVVVASLILGGVILSALVVALNESFHTAYKPCELICTPVCYKKHDKRKR